jgi:L-amino acid N-acyltransferase YncA
MTPRLDMSLRPARPEDVPQIAAIYGQAVLTSTASFEIDPPSIDEMTTRFSRLTLAGYPYLVAVDGALADQADGVLGYAYAGPSHARAAYRFTVENSVYVAQEARGQGVGGALLAALIRTCAEHGYRQMLAVISESSSSAASQALHGRHGFTLVGSARSIGYKFGAWIDVHTMQRSLGEGDRSPPDDAPLP